MTMSLVEVSALVAVSAVVVFVILAPSTDSCYVFPNDIPDPCRGVICGPGALCRSSADGRTADCHCPTSCPSYGDHTGSRPLCGSDAHDYPGECEMRRAACDSGNNITIKYPGKCDPCAGITCPDPEICQLDDNRSPACRCAEPCPLEFSPVCASDGKTYSNECQMNRESCRARKQLRVIFKGQCSSGLNPCNEVVCRHGAECRVDDSGAAHCVCGASCESVLRPVCGSDGRTHDNECELKRAACKQGQDLRILHSGACGSRGACAGRVCPHGGECVPSTTGTGVCRCPHCSAEFAPVCGSDGISYGNRCKLQLEACRHKRDVTVLYDGPCNGCENKKCELYAVCESDGVSEATCVCPKHCEEGTETEEVCGSDNKTYSSLCALRDTACKDRKHITVKHMGTCESCLGVDCPAGTTCARGVCSCATSCAGVSREPVCSNTQRTFPHECALRRAACEARTRGERVPLHVAFYGECSERHKAAILASNNSAMIKDFTNEIHSTSMESEDVTVDVNAAARACSNIHCDYSATCAIGPDGLPRCSCMFDCASAASAPVCASDMRLYPTMCHMRLEACQRQEDLRLRPLVLCRGLEAKPCGGDPPLADSATGRPLDCGSGPLRKDCPAGSYCHQTSKSARCCKKDILVEEKKGCEDSWHGCCADGVTPARGPGGAGCPLQCGCNRLGSFSERCAADSGQCECRPGVGGLKCDRCEPGYWGLPRIGTGHTGCIPCGCSAFGSVREDCEQMTGRCVCKPGIQGQKCTICTNHEHTLGPNGCYDPEAGNIPPTTCERLNCYFGAACTTRGGVATCLCPEQHCPPESSDTPMVCGSDGRTYTSACRLKSHACATQTDVVVQAFGICNDENSPVAVRRGSRSAERRVTIRSSDLADTPCNIYEHFITAQTEIRKHISDACQNVIYPKTEYKPTQLEEASSINKKSPDPESDGYNSIEELEDPYKEPVDVSEHRVKYDIKIPLFDGMGQLKARARLPLHMFDIWAEISIAPGCEGKVGGALLSGSGPSGDHLWLGMAGGNVELFWDAGGGALNLRVTPPSRGRRKMKVAARRYHRDALLELETSSARGTASGHMSSLDLDGFLYLGDPPPNVTRSVGAPGALGGFVGCIHHLRVGQTTLIPPPPSQPSLIVSSYGIKECSSRNLATITCNVLRNPRV